MIAPVQPVEVAAGGRGPSGCKRQDQVGGELAGQVQDAAAAPVDPVDLDAQAAQLVVVGDDVGPAPRPADADRRRVLAEDRAAPPRSPRS